MAKNKAITRFYEQDPDSSFHAETKVRKPKPLDDPSDPVYLSWRTFTRTHQGDSDYVRAYALKAWYEHEKHTYAGWTSLMKKV